MNQDEPKYQIAEIYHVWGALHAAIDGLKHIDDSLAYYQREYRSLSLDVEALGEALDHKPKEYSTISPTVLIRQYIEEVRQLTGKPVMWREEKEGK